MSSQSQRSAWMALSGEFSRNSQHLDKEERVDIGTRLLEMMIADGEPEMGRDWVQSLAQDAESLQDDDARKGRCLRGVADRPA